MGSRIERSPRTTPSITTSLASPSSKLKYSAGTSHRCPHPPPSSPEPSPAPAPAPEPLSEPPVSPSPPPAALPVAPPPCPSKRRPSAHPQHAEAADVSFARAGFRVWCVGLRVAGQGFGSGVRAGLWGSMARFRGEGSECGVFHSAMVFASNGRFGFGERASSTLRKQYTHQERGHNANNICLFALPPNPPLLSRWTVTGTLLYSPANRSGGNLGTNRWFF